MNPQNSEPHVQRLVYTTVVVLALCAVLRLNDQKRKRPRHSLIYEPGAGRRRVLRQLASKNPMTFRRVYRMSSDAFRILLKRLEPFYPPKRHRIDGVETFETLAIFLHWLAHGGSEHDQADYFQHSTDTIWHARHTSMDALLHSGLYDELVRFPTQPLPVTSKFARFGGYCSAVDGSQIEIIVPTELADSFRNRHGDTATNAVLACTPNLLFCYALFGVQGRSHDSLALQFAGQEIDPPPGCFHLGDGGYALTLKMLTPFRGVRYHLKEWASASSRPRDYKELFNLRHAMLRNIIERSLGVLKRRFRIFAKFLDLRSFPSLWELLYCLILLHNFIRTFDAEADVAIEAKVDAKMKKALEKEAAQHRTRSAPVTKKRKTTDKNDERNEEKVESVPQLDLEEAAIWRESIALHMWRDYLFELDRRGLTAEVAPLPKLLHPFD